MPMDETAIKTNLGLILQAVLAAAIENAGFSAIQNFQYDDTCEKPDFLIPNSKNPRFMVEVHQTEARNSFQMKTLRAFTAVTESKAFFGDDLIAVNVLFGNPEIELPASNVRALCGTFDVNLVPRRDARDESAVIKMERAALIFAADEDYKNKTVQAAKELIIQQPEAVATLAQLIKDSLSIATARTDLFPMWQAERVRVQKQGKPPVAGFPTYFKRGLLGSLFLSDEDFSQLSERKDPNLCDLGLQRQLVITKLATVQEDVDGDVYTLHPQFLAFLEQPKATHLRALCKAELDASPSLHWFFEDIRDRRRRSLMARNFVETLKCGKLSTVESLVTALKGEIVGGIEHSRCWPADLLALTVNHSQNDFNRRMVQSGRDPENYQYPFNHISGRFERLLGCPEHFHSYSTSAVDIFEEICSEDSLDADYITAAEVWLPDAILALRLDGAIKLQKFNPLYACLAEICDDCGLDAHPEKIKSITFDLAGGHGRLGKYDAIVIDGNGHVVIAIAVAVHDHNGDHKSKEWGARRLATLYRYQDHKVRKSEFTDALILIDGEWEDKDIVRLHRSGWNHICRLGELESKLRDLFGVKDAVKTGKSKKSMATALESDDA